MSKTLDKGALGWSIAKWQDDLRTFGECVLRRRRQEKSLTQKQMARRIGVDQSRVSRIERGLGTPKDYLTANVYARCYGLNPEETDQWFRLLFGIGAIDNWSVSQADLDHARAAPTGVYQVRIRGDPELAIHWAEELINWLKRKESHLSSSAHLRLLLETHARLLYEQNTAQREILLPSTIVPLTQRVAREIRRIAKELQDDQLHGLAHYCEGDAYYIAGHDSASVQHLTRALHYINNPDDQLAVTRVLALVWTNLDASKQFEACKSKARRLIEGGECLRLEQVCETQEGLARGQAEWGPEEALDFLEQANATCTKLESDNKRVFLRRIQLARTELEVRWRLCPRDTKTLETIGTQALGLFRGHAYQRHEQQIRTLLERALN